MTDESQPLSRAHSPPSAQVEAAGVLLNGDTAPTSGGKLPSANIRRASTQELPIIRDKRLAALTEEADCFGTAAESEPPLTEWKANAPLHDWFGAWIHDQLVGIAAMFFDDTTPDGAPQLGSMWVRKHERHRGVGRDLERAAARRAAERGFDAVGLWVVEGNAAATRTYQSYGYAATGAWKPAPRDSRLRMWRMRRLLPGLAHPERTQRG